MNQYELTLRNVGELLDRRQRTTSFYLTVNTGIAAAIGLILSAYTSMDGFVLWFVVLMLLVAGFASTWIWRSLLRQYETLLGWWYSRLRELEESFSEKNQLITREYNDLYGSGDPNTAKLGMTKREMRLTEFILLLYLLFIVVVLGTLMFAASRSFVQFFLGLGASV